jgi:hypothetical protein
MTVFSDGLRTYLQEMPTFHEILLNVLSGRLISKTAHQNVWCFQTMWMKFSRQVNKYRYFEGRLVLVPVAVILVSMAEIRPIFDSVKT